MKSIQDKIQGEAIKAYMDFPETSATVVIGTGGGKTRLGLKVIEALGASTVLVLYPKDPIKKSWEDEIKTYPVSAKIHLKSYKWVEGQDREDFEEFDFIILDEIHQCLTPARKICLMNSIAKLGITATPEQEKSEKRMLLNQFAPIVYTCLDTEEQGATNVVKDIIMLKNLMPAEKAKYLNIENQYQRACEAVERYFDKMHTNSTFTCAERLRTQGGSYAHYGFTYFRVIQNRREFLSKLLSNVNGVRKIINSIRSRNENEKILVFCNSEIQCKAMVLAIGGDYMHSKRPSKANEKVLEDFKNGDILTLFCVNMVSEGVSVKNLKYGINEGYNSSKTQYKQRRGRFNRMVDKSEKAYFITLVNNETQQLNWAKSFIGKTKVILKNL